MPIKIEPDLYYTPQEAEQLGLPKASTQEKNRSLGLGPPFIKSGKSVLYSGARLIEYFEKNTVRHGAAYKARLAEAAPRKGAKSPTAA